MKHNALGNTEVARAPTPLLDTGEHWGTLGNAGERSGERWGTQRSRGRPHPYWTLGNTGEHWGTLGNRAGNPGEHRDREGAHTPTGHWGTLGKCPANCCLPQLPETRSDLHISGKSFLGRVWPMAVYRSSLKRVVTYTFQGGRFWDVSGQAAP